jgi:DNA ligase (NAD+)
MDMNTNEKLELLKKAKDAYYNSGEEILTDLEYDQLEEELGLENQTEIGSHSINYTIKHPYIMGSLSKVQIKEENKTIDWNKFYSEILKYVGTNTPLIVTPKYDGCSFETIVENSKIISISTRGDGEYGKDIYNHLINKFNQTHTQIKNILTNTIYTTGTYTLRGEVLVNKNKFQNSKFIDQFANPRSFVSATLNRDFDKDDKELHDMIELLDIVIYDIRKKDNKTNTFIDQDWVGYVMNYLPTFNVLLTMKEPSDLERLYNKFEKHRQNCEYALDGFVIKPLSAYRENNLTRIRPKDCVAVKFLPMIQETEIIDIEWSYKKTNELRPVIIVNPVDMDGKIITRASAHNYGYLIDNKISIGTKVQLSLAGDIIPFIYKVTDTSKYDVNKLNLPTDTVFEQDGCHLYKKLTQNEFNKMKFIASANVLQIPHVGPATAEAIFNALQGILPEKDNLLYLMGESVLNRLFLELGGGKSAQNIVDSMRDFKKKITLVDIIKSFCYTGCGEVASELCARIISGLPYDTTGINFEAYQWALSPDSVKYLNVIRLQEALNVPFLTENKEKNDIINVILTGSPGDCSNFKTKTEWLNAHPQYKETTKWNECTILFTGDINSTSSKIKKAQKLNIEIKLYEN